MAVIRERLLRPEAASRTLHFSFAAECSNHQGSLAGTRSADRIEVAVPTETVLKAARTRHTILDQRFAPVVPFLDQRLTYAKPMTLDCGASVGAHTHLREASDLLREFLSFFTGTPFRADVFAQADAQAFLCCHFSARENDLQCAALANDSWQAHGSSVN